MDLVFDMISLLGGLALFLAGMNLLSASLEKRAGNKLKSILEGITSNPVKGFFLGLIVTMIIQSSSATTVMVVGFVNSGVMTLAQSVGVIFGANLGTSITAWILALQDIGENVSFMKIFKPTTFVPILAFIGMLLFAFQKNPKKKDTGMVLLGFSILMYGMEIMSGSVQGLNEIKGFKEVLVMFSNPVLGVLVGTVFTAIIQSSSASVGILQALTRTGSVTYATAIPIIMGQNIGTCVSALISSIGASKNAKRAAVIHLSFNIIATLIILPLYYLLDMIFSFQLPPSATGLGIAVVHTVFKIIALIILCPFSRLFEKLSKFIVKDDDGNDHTQLLDERLMATPSVAVERCKAVAVQMAELAVSSIKESFLMLTDFDEKTAEKLREAEDEVDIYEDKLGTYLVKITSHSLSESDSAEVNKLLHVIGDFERISDHSINIVDSAEEMADKKLTFSEEAKQELSVLVSAVSEILDLALVTFRDNDLDTAIKVEPLEQVVDYLRDYLKKQHIARLTKQECTIEMGFVLSDLLTNLERVSDHCSNIAGCVLEISHDNMDIHEYLRGIKGDGNSLYSRYYDSFKEKYSVSAG